VVDRLRFESVKTTDKCLLDFACLGPGFGYIPAFNSYYFI